MSKVKDIFVCIFLLALASLVFYLLATSVLSNRDTAQELSDLQEKYDDLQEKYDDLKEVHSEMKMYYQFRDDSVVDDLWSCEDDIATLYCYFEGEDYVNLSEAKESFNRFHTVYKKHCHY